MPKNTAFFALRRKSAVCLAPIGRVCGTAGLTPIDIAR